MTTERIFYCKTAVRMLGFLYEKNNILFEDTLRPSLCVLSWITP